MFVEIVYFFQLQSVIFIPFGIMFQEDVPCWQQDLFGTENRLNKGSIVILLWTVGMFLLVQSYHGNLKAVTIIKSYEIPMTRLEELIER